MKHLYTSRKMSRVFRGLVLALALILVACGGDAEDPTPTVPADDGQVAAPTVPAGASTPDTEVSEDEITVLPPEVPATPDAATPDDLDDVADEATAEVVASPEDSLVDLTQTDLNEPAEAEEVDVASTPPDAESQATPPADADATPPTEVEAVSPEASEEDDTETDAEPTERALTGDETFDHPGDGTGGSGMPGELNGDDQDEEAELAATPEASPVAQLSIAGCDVPDVPGFLGDNSAYILLTDLNFRSGPGVDCDPVMDDPLGEGQTVEVIGGPVTQTEDGSEWVQIEIDGEPGWITTDFIEPVE